MTSKVDSRPRRQQINETASVPETNIGEPMEIPMGGIPKQGLAQQIQEQIAIQMAKKTPGKST